MRTCRVLAVAVFALVAVSTMRGSVISAHHSMAGYDSEREVILQGVVSEYVWRNPHVFVLWDVTDDNGKVVRWTGEFPAINTNLSLGMSRNSLKVGDEIAVTGYPSRLGTPEARVWKIVKPDGTVVVDLSIRFQQ